MKRRNNSKSIMQQGGLMIEALAMLGLIAVVTPTMYKKSAERTMEVEDINSATTIRTIMNAANDYVGANYSTIISDMNKAEGDANKYRPITRAQIEPYLPYGFNMNKALYNYDFPELAIAKNDNNLTTFALFPAKAGADTGIGQERTSRIASLVGASGGYVTESGKARGIGGIWRLEGDAFNKVFPTSGSGANTYSIVTASADTINAATGNEIDMDKYLQRGRDDPNDTSTLWKNTMRTDLYMGVNKSDDDVYKNDAPNKVQDKLYSIRNIKSLIVGAEKTGLDETGNEAGGYGLYIEGSNAGGLTGNPNAFIRGSVRAAQEQFYVTDTKLSYGKFDDTNFNFQIDKETGNTISKGALVNEKNLDLANKVTTTGENAVQGWDSIKIGALSNNKHIIEAQPKDGAHVGKVNLLSDDILSASGYAGDNKADNDRIVMLNSGYKKLSDSSDVPTLSYNTSPTFPMRVGANAKFEGLVAAGQLDTQKIRAASLSVGSEKIDDANKWMTVDKNGVIIENPDNGGTGTYAVFNKDNIFLRIDTEKQTLDGDYKDSDHPSQLNLRNSKRIIGTKNFNYSVAELFGNHTDVRGYEQLKLSGGGVILQADKEIKYTGKGTEDAFKDKVDQNTLLLRNNNMQMKMSSVSGKNADGNAIKGAETVFSPRNSANKSNTRAVFSQMHVDLAGSNLKVLNYNDAPVFSVKGSAGGEESLFDKNYSDNYIKSSTATKEYEGGNYDVAMHGNVIIAPSSSNGADAYANVSIGKLNKKAGINIVSSPYSKTGNKITTNMGGTYNANSTNIVMIDQNGTDTYGSNAYSHSGSDMVTDPGTVYIRKGYVEVNGERSVNRSTASSNDAFKGNGVLVASRLVANNPVDDTTGDGYQFPQIIKGDELTDHGISTSGRYDTYMVNPAYTSVMHDIKLTTRGGARLSDVLPDFINKGIYVVNNTVLENVESIDTKKDGYEAIAQKLQNANKDSTANLGAADAWASPYLGAVPAPQCPPGYGRVITLNPSAFQMAQAGSLHSDGRSTSGGTYYVAPYAPSTEQAQPSGEPTYEIVNVEGSISGVNGASFVNGKTQKYVLASKLNTGTNPNNASQPAMPLVFQQSTWLKSMVKEIYSGSYVQGWIAIMGFLYPSAQYSAFTGNIASAEKADENVYWNLFPVARGTLEGYATVYCYFDRTNMFKDKHTGYTGDWEKYIDSYTYMQTMRYVPSDYKKASPGASYLKRLNDPNMKYNEVW